MGNREKIMECSVDLFYRKGYESVGVQEICNAAGVTKPTLYHYFKSKYGLLESILKEKYSEFGYRIEEVSRSNEDIKFVLLQIAKAYMEYFSANIKVHQIFISLQYSALESEGHRAIEPYVQRIYDSIIGAFDRVSYKLGNMRGRQFVFATSFIGSMTTYLLMRHNTSRNKDSFFVSQEEIYNVTHQFLHGIYS